MERRKHPKLTGAEAIHQAAFIQATDPALDANNKVLAYKLWLDTSVSPNVLKYRNAGNTAWTSVSFSSGGALGQTFSMDAKPSSPASQSDYFETNALDAKWTRFQGSFSTLTVDGALRFSMASQASDKNNGIFQLLPSGDCTIITKIYYPIHKSNFSVVGLTLFQDATNNPNTTDFVSLDILNLSGSTRLDFRKFNDYQTFNSNLISSIVTFGGMTDNPVYLRLVRSGTTWTPSYSFNGKSWTVSSGVTQATIGWTPAEFGVIVNNLVWGGTITPIFPFIFYTNSATAELNGGKV